MNFERENPPAGRLEKTPRGNAPLAPEGIRKEDFLRIRPKLVAKIRRFGINADEVEDIVQETFFAAHEGLAAKSFENRSALDTWVIGIGKNLCLKHHRARRAAKRNSPEVSIEASNRDPAAPHLELASGEPPPDRRTADRQRLARVVTLVRDLPSILRDPLVLKARGHSYRQIARILAISPQLVSSRLHQARSELHRKLAEPAGS